jgi:hypothetical protein
MSQFKFSSEAFMLGQISCEMISLSQDLNKNQGKKLNGELVDLEKILKRINQVKTLILKKDECL